jgi:sugar lactone lactonase YvrE
MDSVPTSVVRGPDGALYVSELTGFPFPVGEARVYRIAPGQDPEVWATGFTNITDIAFDDAGNLYVVEIAHNSLASKAPTGAVLRVSPNGATTTVVLDEGLAFPTSVAITEAGDLLVTNCGVCPGGGEVLEIAVP